MTTFRTQKNRDNPYVMLHKGFLEDPKLSAKAKGILAYLLSKPDNWRTQLRDLEKHFRDKRDSLQSGLKELSHHGYFVRRSVRDEKGRITHWETDVYESPQQPEAVQADVAEPDQEKPDLDNPDVAEPDQEKPDLDNPDVAEPDQEKPEVLINNDLQLINELTNTPLTPQGEPEEKEPPTSENRTFPAQRRGSTPQTSTTLSNQPEPLDKPVDPHEDSFSGGGAAKKFVRESENEISDNPSLAVLTERVPVPDDIGNAVRDGQVGSDVCGGAGDGVVTDNVAGSSGGISKYIHPTQKVEDRFKNRLHPWQKSHKPNDFVEGFVEYLRTQHLPTTDYYKLKKVVTPGNAKNWINQRQWDKQGIAEILAIWEDWCQSQQEEKTTLNSEKALTKWEIMMQQQAEAERAARPEPKRPLTKEEIFNRPKKKSHGFS